MWFEVLLFEMLFLLKAVLWSEVGVVRLMLFLLDYQQERQNHFEFDQQH